MKIDFDYVRRAGRNVRVHGNGFVQIDIPSTIGMGERIHVFGHPGVPRQLTPTPIHDHRFGFESKVLSGCLVNVDWGFTEAGPKDSHTHFVCSWDAPPPGSEDTKLIPSSVTGKLWAVDRSVMLPGERYTVDPGELHETFANEATITHMVKTCSEVIQPRVLCRIGQDPDNSFDRHAVLSETHLWEIVEDAFRTGGLLS